MRSENEPGGQKGAELQKERSFIEEARRAQIVAAAIEVIAEQGFARASLARIATYAGISKGVISYHFAGKDELMEEVVDHVYTGVGAHIMAAMEGVESASGLIRAYVLAAAEHMRDRPRHLKALGEIFHNLRTADGQPRYGVHTSEELYQGLEGIFRLGRESGEFRDDVDDRVMAVTLLAAVDTMFAYWVVTPGHDLEAHAVQLADLFERACRR